MNVAWTGEDKFGNWLRETLEPGWSVVAANDAVSARCIALVVENDEAVEDDRWVGSILRVVDIEKLPLLAETAGPLGVVLVRAQELEPLLLHAIERLAAQSELDLLRKVINGPIAHDIRGAAGIVHLVSEILSQDEAKAKVTDRLKSAVGKLNAQLQDLEVMSAPLSEQSTMSQATFDAEMVALRKWRDSVHRRREINISSDGPVGKMMAPENCAFVLRALLESLVRMSSPSTELSLELAKHGDSVRCVIGCRLEDEGEVAQLERIFLTVMTSENLSLEDESLLRTQKAARILELQRSTLTTSTDEKKFSIVIEFS